jgi:hypothetical protein
MRFFPENRLVIVFVFEIFAYFLPNHVLDSTEEFLITLRRGIVKIDLALDLVNGIIEIVYLF